LGKHFTGQADLRHQGEIENSEADPWELISEISSNTTFFVWVLFYPQGLPRAFPSSHLFAKCFVILKSIPVFFYTVMKTQKSKGQTQKAFDSVKPIF